MPNIEATARAMLAVIVRDGPIAIDGITAYDLPSWKSATFAAAFARLTAGGLVSYAGEADTVRGNSRPMFEATPEGRRLALLIPASR